MNMVIYKKIAWSLDDVIVSVPW